MGSTPSSSLNDTGYSVEAFLLITANNRIHAINKQYHFFRIFTPCYQNMR